MADDSQLDKPTGWPIYGHAWAVQLLRRTVAPEAVAGGPRHAYLLLGPGQIGKTTLGRAFAQALLCAQDGPRPCGDCRACRLMARHGHPDFLLVQPTIRDGDGNLAVDRANGMLRVEQAAEVIHDAGLRPVEAARRVFLIQDVHRANPGFGNKLLKTLEEPPDHVVLILTALDRDSVLPTIVSRCQVLELRPVDEATIAAALMRDTHMDAAQATLLARLANGRVGWALEQPADAAGTAPKGLPLPRQEQLAQLQGLIAGSRVERLAFAEQLAAGRNNQQLFPMLALWTAWWRDVMLAQAGYAEACSNIDQTAAVAKLAATIPPGEVRAYLGALQRIEGYLRHTVNTRLALDVLLLQMPHATL